MADIERKLASVRRIAAIDPIEGADKIVCVTVDGWKLVSAKENGFQVGDLVIYFEIDSFLPVRPEFEWMRERCFRTVPGLGEGFRVKTIKLRGQVSQGLIVPLTDFLQCANDFTDYYWYESNGETYRVEEGSDLTEFLGVKKYEKPLPAALAGRVRGNFPSFIRKTDEERVQNCLGGVKKWVFNGSDDVVQVTDEKMIAKLEEGLTLFDGAQPIVTFKNGDMWFEKHTVLNDAETIKRRQLFEMTMKLDGSSMTVYHNEGQIGVCSRNLDLKRDPDNSFWSCALRTGILLYLLHDGRNLAVQGELMGPGVQDNRESLPELEFYVFNIFDIDLQEYWMPEERNEWFDYMLGSTLINRMYLKHVPQLGTWILQEDDDVAEFLASADGQPSIKHPIAEGLVFKSHEPRGPSFKAISNKFLLKEKDD